MSNLVVKQLVKEFPTPAEPLRVLDKVDLTVSAGQNLAIVGPSGCGKTTFLQIVGTLERPTSGTVKLHDSDLLALDEKQLADFRNENIGFVFQEHFLLPQLTAVENVLIPALARGKVTRDLQRRAEQLLESVGLEERIHHRPSEMSGGERQRVAVARALILKPLLVLADEPTGNLDQNTAGTIGELLIKMQQLENAMLICVTHSQELASHFQQVKRLDHGKFVSDSAAV